MENIFVEFLPPWVETGLQPAFYDKESGTALQQTARMYARVNMLIRMFNKLSKNTKETVEDYINRFNELYNYVHDYFDNLDVQEEINNKLDQMAEDGVLQEIIGEYLNATAVWGFDTVADMKASTNLINGSFARTLGYHAKDDGGASLYKIRNITNDDVIDGGKIIKLNDPQNLLIAELIINDSVTPEQFGAYGDGTHDDHDSLALALSHCKVLKLIQRKTYKLGSTLTITYQMMIDGNNSLLIGDSEGSYPILTVDGNTSPAYRTKNVIENLRIECGSDQNDRVHEGILFNKAADFTIRNVYVRYATNGFHFKSSLIFQFENCHVQNTNCALYCDDVSYSHINNVKFDKCTFVANKYVLNSTEFAFKNAMFINCEIEANTSDNDDAVIVVPDSQGGTGGCALIFESCWFETNAPRDIKAETDRMTPIIVNNCYITHQSGTAKCFATSTNAEFAITVSNCQDRSTYQNSGTTIDSSSQYALTLNCYARLNPSQMGSATGLWDNYGIKNKASIWELTMIQNGSVKTGQIKASSDFLNINANTTNGVRLSDCNYLHPFILGSGANAVYLWPYGTKLYYKIGSAPSAYNDGTVWIGR